MLGVLVWIVVILLICFSVFGGSWLLPLYVLFVVVVGFYFGVKYLDMIEKEQKAKRVYHRTKPASKSKVRAIRFDLDLVEFINLQPNVSLFINDLIRREKEKIERMKAIEVREILKEME